MIWGRLIRRNMISLQLNENMAQNVAESKRRIHMADPDMIGTKVKDDSPDILRNHNPSHVRFQLK